MQYSVRSPRSASANPPTLILMHGLGADEHDLLDLGAELDDRLRVVSLRAPREYDFGGFAWFDVAWDEAGVHVNQDQAVESLGLLLDELSGLTEGSGPVFVAGFSQGAMMSLGLAMAMPERLAGAMLFSGRVLPRFVPDEPPPDLARLPFLVQHGTLDQVLPVDGGRALRKLLEGYGCPVDYREYPMGHEISPQSFADAKTWLRSEL